MEIRAYQPSDANTLGTVFHRSVREGAQPVYTPEQVAAWCATPPRGTGWHDRLSAHKTFVAEKDTALIGFMTLDETGYIDLAFVLPDHMGTGVATSLYVVLENHARAEKMARLTSQASLLAEPFFLRQGWHITKRQTVARHGVDLPNAWMAKSLSSV